MMFLGKIATVLAAETASKAAVEASTKSLGEAFLYYGVRLAVFAAVAALGIGLGIALRKKKEKKESEEE